MPLLERFRERLRPYYLRWIYFPLFPGRKPEPFRACWRFPFERLGPERRLEAPASGLPDLVFYPMTDWHGRTQRTRQLAHAFGRLGYRCIYLNPNLGREYESGPLFDRSARLARLEPNVFELHVRLPREPVYHYRLLRPEEETVLASTLRGLLPGSRGGAVQIVSFPVWLGVARRLRESAGFPLIYDCHDFLSGFGNIAGDILAAEVDLLRDADLVLFSSEELQQAHRRLRASMLLRNGVDAGHFQDARAAGDLPPAAGYVGALEDWFDIECLEAAARANPECRFVLVGRVDHAPIRRLKSLPNVEFSGEVPYDKLPEICAQFRVGLIPFRLNALTLATNPIKLYEYFSCGMPVVSTALPEVERMGDLAYVARTPVEFAAAVREAMRENDSARRGRRLEIAARESWTARAQALAARFQAFASGLPRTLHIGGYWRGQNDIVRQMMLGLRAAGADVWEFNTDLRREALETDGLPYDRGTSGPVWLKWDVIGPEIEAFRPELIICNAGGLSFRPERAEQIKAQCLLVGIALSDPDVFQPTTSKIARNFHVFLTNAPQCVAAYRAAGVRAIQLPIATNEEFFQPVPPREELRCDALLIGRAHRDRIEPARALRERFDVHVYGEGWERYGVPSRGFIYGQDLLAALNSALVTVIFSRTPAGHGIIKVGLFDFLAAGALVAADYIPELENYFEPGREILTFRSVEELIAIVEHCRRNPDEAAAVRAAGRARVLRDHTWRAVWPRLLQSINGLTTNCASEKSAT
jgi:glycosyltransferase involved in cell wall biosynthesis